MTYSFKISKNTILKAKEFYKDKKRSKTPQYAIFQADDADTVITLYESGKIVFQGLSADIDANIWRQMEANLNNGKLPEEKPKNDKNKKDKTKLLDDKKYYNSSTIGSDEVGTGDYFGPIVVTASFVDKNDIPFLEELKIKDSKKMTDEEILTIVPKFIKKIKYESIILNNKEYNEKYSKTINMNTMKAYLHNKAIYNLISKENLNYDYIVIDQFVNQKKYYEYLNKSSSVVFNLIFLTKAEDKVLSVAVSSLISRYIFLNELDKLGESLDIFLPKGASNLVDEVGVKIVKKYGFDKLISIAKINFKNTDKIKEGLKII